MEPPNKRARLGDNSRDASSSRATPSTLLQPITPPEKKARIAGPSEPTEAIQVSEQSSGLGGRVNSPFQLTRIKGLSEKANADSVALKDILGDPLIKECWEFNYLHDIDFLMAAFDEDVSHLVKVHVVHGFWKREDPNRIALQEQAAQHKNVELHAAYLPEMFGTHHSKMMLLLRHDDTAQVIIHTANMIDRDWRNMTQALWRSPLLPLQVEGDSESVEEEALPIGSGQRFKKDLLSYLRAYDDKRPVCKPIIQELAKYDFSTIRGSLIASVPGRHNTNDLSETQWGWSALKHALRTVPVTQQGKAEIVVQISSIATLGPTDSWLLNTLFTSLGNAKRPSAQKPEFKVVFPTPDEIRRSLDGYGSGASIHTKVQSPQQAKQLEYLRPIFYHWANDSASGMKLPDRVPIMEAGRKRAAPHIKTYIRYAEGSTIDWALVTSANLSKQAWGDPAKPSGEFRIASYEIGVLVWPSLFAEDAVMIPTFGTDEPSEEVGGGGKTVVGIRVPYNLPLQRYSKDEDPWVATMSYNEPDWMGQLWRQH